MRISRFSTPVLVLLLLAGCGTAGPATPTPLSMIPPTPTVGSAEPTATPTTTSTFSTAPAPTAVASTATPPPTTRPAMQQRITLKVPAAGATVTSPVELSGTVAISPFESNLRGRVYDAAGQVVGEGPIQVAAQMGQPGTFSGRLAFTIRTGGPGRVEVADMSAKDDSVIALASTAVTLVVAPSGGAIEIPAANERVTLPLHILARAGQPGEQMTAALTWQDGTVLKQSVPVLPGETGEGIVIASIDWMNEGPPPMPATQPATLELWNQAGERVASQAVTVLHPQDPDVQQVTLYFVLGESLQAVQRNIPKTEGIGTAALNELLWGPPPNNLAGFETAIPTPEEVLRFSGRGPDWGPRVTLRLLTIVDGVAVADFSKEMNAYAGGSLRVKLLRDQITQTLLQFPTVKQVVISVEGQTEDVLQPQ